MREMAAQADAEGQAEEQEVGDAGEDSDVELSPEDWRAWQVLMACRHAWRIVAGLGGIWYEGLDPSAVLATLQMLRIPPKHWPDVHYRLAILEDETRKHLNKPPDD